MDQSVSFLDADEHVRRYRLCRSGFILIGAGLLLRALDVALHAAMLATFGRPPFGELISSPWYGWVVRAPMILAMLAGPYALWGRWPDRAWLRRSGLLIVIGLVDLILFGLDHQEELGLGEGELGHTWSRLHLARAVSWAQVLLAIGLLGDFQDHLEGRRSGARARNLLAMPFTGIVLWILYFVQMTDWDGGWPLGQRNLMPTSWLLLLAYLALLALVAVQLTGVSWACARESGTLVREIEATRFNGMFDPLRSRSESGFEEFTRPGRRESGTLVREIEATRSDPMSDPLRSRSESGFEEFTRPGRRS